jgi:CheY-like chemotaxis protein
MARVPNVVPRERAFRPLIRAVRRVAIGAPPCPYCGSDDVRRSIRRSFREFLFACLLLAPFRCRKCQWRFFRVWRPAPKNLPEPPRAPVLVMPRQVLEIDPIQPYPVEIVEHIEPPPILVPPVRLIRPRSILILESDLSIRKLLRRLLDRRGYFTHEVAGPDDLAAELRERRVDLLVVDGALMGMNGLDAAFALAGVNPKLKILALSLESPDPAGIPARCLALTKPFSLESFLESVDHLLEPVAG